jgi:hypothetical protein
VYVQAREWDPERREIRYELYRPGTYDLVVWDHASWSVGMARGVTVTAGAATRAEVTLVAGTTVRVPDLPGVGAVAKRVEVRADDVGDLPLVSFPANHTEQGYDAVAPRVPLGPYPFPKVVVRYDDADGKVREHVVGK